MSIRQLFESRLSEWAMPRGMVIAWENAPFTPPESTYLRAFLLRAATISRDLAGDHRGYTGLFQVNVIAPIGSGSGAAEALAQEVVDLYPQRMTDGEIIVLITRPMGLHPALQDADRYTVPISCQYRVDTYPQ